MGRTGTLLAVCAFAALAACNKVDTKKFEEDLAKDLEAGGFTGAKVSCPKDVKAKKGNTFQCDATIDGKTYKLDVEITEVDGSDLQMFTKFADGEPLVRSKVIEIVTPSIKETTGVEPKVDCGEDTLLFAKDNKIYCDITAEGQPPAKVRIDVDGTEIKGWEIEK